LRTRLSKRPADAHIAADCIFKINKSRIARKEFHNAS
jgi:hypothetical protein